MFSKHHQANYLKSIKEELEKFDEAKDKISEYGVELPILSDGAKLYRDKGVVQEQWQAVGVNIEYTKSKLERGGWQVPGPLNLEDEEEENIDQDDLKVLVTNSDFNEPLKGETHRVVERPDPSPNS